MRQVRTRFASAAMAAARTIDCATRRIAHHSGLAPSEGSAPEEDKVVSILERLLYQQGRAAKINDRQREGMSAGDSSGRMAKPDMLPLSQPSSRFCRECSVLVAVTGEALDHEMMALACTVAKEKHTNVVHAIYGIDVPRTMAVDDEMTDERKKADEALKSAANDARPYEIKVDKEYIQSRNFGQSLVDAARDNGCALLIVGLPYRAQTEEGQFELTDTVDYVLKNAPCRVWVVRGQPPLDEPEVAEAGVRSQQREAATAH